MPHYMLTFHAPVPDFDESLKCGRQVMWRQEMNQLFSATSDDDALNQVKKLQEFFPDMKTDSLERIIEPFIDDRVPVLLVSEG